MINDQSHLNSIFLMPCEMENGMYFSQVNWLFCKAVFSVWHANCW